MKAKKALIKGKINPKVGIYNSDLSIIVILVPIIRNIGENIKIIAEMALYILTIEASISFFQIL